jgi:hypothetical protein
MSEVYLERSAHAEDAVVRLLGCQALHGALHDLALLGNQIVGPVVLISPLFPSLYHSCSPMASASGSRSFVPQAELPVSGVVEVPLAERLGPAHQPGALHDVGGERGLRHLCGDVCGG